jgi:hypothetical protein
MNVGYLVRKTVNVWKACVTTEFILSNPCILKALAVTSVSTCSYRYHLSYVVVNLCRKLLFFSFTVSSFMWVIPLQCICVFLSSHVLACLLPDFLHIVPILLFISWFRSACWVSFLVTSWKFSLGYFLYSLLKCVSINIPYSVQWLSYLLWHLFLNYVQILVLILSWVFLL